MKIEQAQQMALDLSESKIRSIWFNAVQTAVNIEFNILGKSDVRYEDFILSVYQAYCISLERALADKEKRIAA